MRKQRFIFGLLVSLSVIACNARPDSAESSSSGSNTSGGGSVHVDSLKRTGSNNQPPNTLGTPDTPALGHSTADTSSKKKP